MRYSVGFIFIVALAMAGFAACGEDSSCGEPLDVAGDWEMTSKVETDECDERSDQMYRMTITQDGNDVTGETEEFGTFTGTICGDRMQLNSSFSADGGTVKVKATLTVSADGNSMEGTDSWTWTDGSETCSGSDSLIATRETCDSIFGDAEGYILCDETDITCKFYVVLNDSSCTQLCSTFGTTCVNAIQDNDGCEEIGPGLCDDVVGDRICVCSKP